jgi:hypothetical protein
VDLTDPPRRHEIQNFDDRHSGGECMSLRSQTVLVGLLVFIASVAIPVAAHAGDFGQLTPFWTDACTAFPDGTPDDPTLWQHCCVEHDLKYWAGGTLEQKADADGDLFNCVSDTGQPVIAALMVAGVAVGGTPFLPTFYRWGYGWPKLRGFAPLSQDEEMQVHELTPPDLSAVPITKVF